MKTIYIILMCALCHLTDSVAATIQINWSTSRDLLDRFVTPLSAGTILNGDGTLLQLGFYTSATASDPFAGNWVVIAVSSIGDTDINQDGRFSTTSLLTEGSFTSPSLGTPLAIRYYNGSTVANSSFFNAASDISGGWNWVSPEILPPSLTLQINKDTSIFQSGIIGAFQTRISTSIPEPSTALSIFLFVGYLLCFRTR